MKNELTFEQALIQLEETVKALETGNISLDESIKLYEKAIGLSKECKAKLENAKQKIEILENENYEENDIVATIITEN